MNLKKSLFNVYFGSLAFATMSLMMLVVTQVFTRYCFGISPIWMEETISYLLVYCGLVGSSYAFYQKKHIALTFLHDKVSEKSKQILQIIVDVCVIVFTILVQIVGGIFFVVQTKNIASVGIGYPLIYLHILLPISGVIIVALLLISLKEKICEFMRKEV